MRLNRVFVEAALAPAAEQWVQGSAAGHIVRVLRLRAGDALTVFDGRGGEYAARIAQLRKEQVLIEVGEHRAIERESPLSLTLAQGVSRGERMDWVVQKATELGVRRIVPVLAERTVVRLEATQAEARMRHWRAIIVAACEQCGRNRVPELTPVHRLGDFLAGLAADTMRLMLSPLGATGLNAVPAGRGLTLLVGPEGGLSHEEQDQALAAGFQALRLGPRVLRTETAAVAALAVLQQRLGDL
jgi:16S rRNA (uracil1498-N3)-methyltransferase